MKIKDKITSEESAILESKSIYLNPFLDISFKKLFGEEDAKDILIGFLNDVFNGERVIKEIFYMNGEILPTYKDSKGSAVDILCRDENGDHYIVEMQLKDHSYFTERMLYYLSKVTGKLLKRGERYDEIKGVYSVVLMRFTIPRFKQKPILKFMMCDINNPEIVLNNKITQIFIQLPLCEKDDYTKCCLPIEKWLYLLLNMKNFNTMPDYLEQEKALFKEFLERAKVENMSEDELFIYDNEVRKWDIHLATIEYAQEKGLAEGREQGREQGLVQGLEQGLEQGREQARLEKLDIAKGLKYAGVDFLVIMETIGLSKEELETL